MTPFQAIRAAAAEQRRQQRAAQIRQKELARQTKEQAKLSAQQRARLEVDSYENALEILLSVHQGECSAFNWNEVLNTPPPFLPVRKRTHELRARWDIARNGENAADTNAGSINEAFRRDEQVFQTESDAFRDRLREWELLRGIARGVVNGDGKAYIEALLEVNPFEEISLLGSALHFTVHSRSFLEVRLNVNGKQVIPSQVKTLTSSGKLSTKPMPRVRFQEIYQDYVCSCALRVVREVFALLPIELVLLTASAELLDKGTGTTGEKPVLSVVFSREQVHGLDFERIDPSDAVERFQHRGDFKASRKTEAFAPIVALTPSDLPPGLATEGTFDGALGAIRLVYAAIADIRERLREIEAPDVEDDATIQ